MSVLRRWLKALVGVVLLSAIRGLRRREPEEPGPSLPPRASRASLIVAALLLATGASAAAFVVVYLATDSNALLGLTLGASFAFLALALVIASRRLVPQVEASEQRGPAPDPPELSDEAVEEIVGGPPLPRRSVLIAAAAAAFGTLGAALLIPLASLGSGVDDRLDGSPWRRGRRLVDVDGKPLVASEIALGAFLTAFPEGADRRASAAPIVVVRIPPETLDLPSGRRGWAPQGILAYSKTCTHAACAVSLFRDPLSPGTSAGPALVCPCHYSTFDVARGAKPIFGPAARALPQLPLEISKDGMLVAGGPLSGNTGPSWWGVRQ
ncbi:MAG TPA: Rieske 2Fe-2S domain-containing protein [Gaiellales bacterium]|jgi:ubiquinol-cytochrome c reductase iron-sulfur subunit